MEEVSDGQEELADPEPRGPRVVPPPPAPVFSRTGTPSSPATESAISLRVAGASRAARVAVSARSSAAADTPFPRAQRISLRTRRAVPRPYIATSEAGTR